MAKKGPGYLTCGGDRSQCTGRKADPRNGCPTCEYTIQEKIFRQELDTKLKFMKRGTRKGMRKWPSSVLVATANEIAGISASSKKIKPNWPIPVVILVSIYRDELRKRKVVANFNLAQQAAGSEEK